MDLGHFLDDLDCSCSETPPVISIGREGDKACFVRGQRGGQRAALVSQKSNFVFDGSRVVFRGSQPIATRFGGFRLH